MIHASTTASASASAARRVESHTVVHTMRHTSGCAITSSDARTESQEIAPGRPGGASLKPARSAVTTGVTVSAATTTSSSVASTPAMPTRERAERARAQTPTAVATGRLSLLRSFRDAAHAAEQRVARGTAPAGTARKGPTGGWVERRAGGGGTPRQDPQLRASRAGRDRRSGLVVEELRGDDPLQDLADLALGLVVADELELVRGGIVARV